jgi:muramoyltetrapeptide carboxypeptidase
LLPNLVAIRHDRVLQNQVSLCTDRDTTNGQCTCHRAKRTQVDRNSRRLYVPHTPLEIALTSEYAAATMHASTIRPHGDITVRPPLLAAGARVALVAPAGPLRGEEDVERAIANARAIGWEPTLGEHVLERCGYLAGGDAARLADLNRALAARDVDGVWCLRGGYGVSRILDGVNYDALRQRPKAIIGYSDITALHLAVRARCNLITYHGPTARGELSGFTRRSLIRAVMRGEESCGLAPAARTLRGGRARGVLVGGNLALVTALQGTPFAARLDHAILVLEDVNEAAYRIDRMMQQLRLSGALAGCAGLVFGAFTERGDDGDEDGRALDRLLEECAAAAGVPCLRDVPVGHIDDQWTLPLGATAELDADGLRLTVDPVVS